MIRRNIDVTLGLVNSTIAKLVSVTRAADNDVEKLKIILPTGQEHIIERVCVKFEVMDRAFVIRKQFPICLSYGITIHKSQGLSLQNAVVEAGNSIFTCGQIYVALSRVTTLQGLHLINYDPSSVKAQESAIIEYNRLRKKYRPDLMTISISKNRVRNVRDAVWAVPNYNVSECQNTNDHIADTTQYNVRGLPNSDGVSCYANATIQCMLYCSSIRENLFSTEKADHIIKVFMDLYKSDQNPNIISLRQFTGEKYAYNQLHDAAEFITSLCDHEILIKNAVQHEITTVLRCLACNYTSTTISTNCVVHLALPKMLKKNI